MKENTFDLFPENDDLISSEECEISISNIKKELDNLLKGIEREKELLAEMRYIIENMMTGKEEGD